MAELITISRPYAKAIFEIAVQKKMLEKCSSLLSDLVAIVSDKALVEIIDNPKYKKIEVRSVIQGLLAENDSVGIGLNLLSVLQEYGRLKLLPEIAQQYESLKEAFQKEASAIIESAFPLSTEEQNQLSVVLSQKFDKRVKVEVSLKPELIGGVRILIKDRIIDYSIRGKLQAMAICLNN